MKLWDAGFLVRLVLLSPLPDGAIANSITFLFVFPDRQIESAFRLVAGRRFELRTYGARCSASTKIYMIDKERLVLAPMKKAAIVLLQRLP